jgi:hypothetical protein
MDADHLPDSERELWHRLVTLEDERDVWRTFTRVALTRLHELEGQLRLARQQAESLRGELRRYTAAVASGGRRRE